MAKPLKPPRVYFMDDSFKAFGIDSNTTAEQLRQAVIEKINLKEDGCFAIFERKEDCERCLEPEEKPMEIMKSWETMKCNPEPSFVFKKKIFLKDDKDGDREMGDPTARNLVYIQAVSNVIEGVYICTVEEAIKLAGLQVQAVYGDHNPSIHNVGFLNRELKNFVPKHLYGQKKPQEWETLILKQHQGHKGLPKDDAKLEYLKIVKNWPDYGTTFYPACKSTNKNLPGKVIIGINFEGIRLINPKKREVISEHLFTEICSWASSSGTFAFEFGNQNDATKYTFETKHGAIIAAAIQTYIDILVQMLKNGEEDDDTTKSITDN